MCDHSAVKESHGATVNELKLQVRFAQYFSLHHESGNRSGSFFKCSQIAHSVLLYTHLIHRDALLYSTSRIARYQEVVNISIRRLNTT
jgi:hypothetical protein